LSSYKALQELPLGKPSALELHPDINKIEDPASFHNYLDEFLQAVRVFGFLEKPVFHELARHLQTRRLIAGDTLSLDADKSFYCVVDGNVQVFAPPPENSRGAGHNHDPQDDDWGSDMNGYQLLNDVGSGGTLSSLFTILSLFTEDIQLRWSDSAPTPASTTTLSPSLSHSHSTASRRRGRYDSDVSHMDLGGPAEDPQISPTNASGRRKGSVVSSQSSVGSTSTVHVSHETPTISTFNMAVHDDPDQDWNPTTWSPPSEASSGTPNRTSSRRNSDYFAGTQRTKAQKANTTLQQGTIARATTDATLAVIPAEAFRRLTQKYPKASAHIVQGRFSIFNSFQKGQLIAS
jgi:lysophospholipid hydrolase